MMPLHTHMTVEIRYHGETHLASVVRFEKNKPFVQILDDIRLVGTELAPGDYTITDPWVSQEGEE